MTGSLERLRLGGWQMIHHADTATLAGTQTLWFFVHPCGRWVTGTGASYEDAWAQAESTAGTIDTSLPAEVGDVASRWLNQALFAWKAYLDWLQVRGAGEPPRNEALAEVWTEAVDTVLGVLHEDFLTSADMSEDRLDMTPGRRRMIATIEALFRDNGFVDRTGTPLRGRGFVERFKGPSATVEPEAVYAAFEAMFRKGALLVSDHEKKRLRDLGDWIRDRSAEEWQEIDTAPRDGHGHRSALDIDLWHKVQGRMTECFWDEKLQAWMSRSGGRAFNVGGDENFSHWRLQPSAPMGVAP